MAICEVDDKALTDRRFIVKEGMYRTLYKVITGLNRTESIECKGTLSLLGKVTKELNLTTRNEMIKGTCYMTCST